MDPASTAPPPPSGIHHPYATDRARSVVAICAVFMFIATFAVVLRFWSKRIKRNSLGLDDWLVVSGLIFYYFSAIQTILQVRIGGLGHHVSEGVTPEELVITNKLGTYGQYAYALSMGSIRWSIIALFDRLFITKSFRRAALTVNVINLLWIFFSILVVSLRCLPFSKNWNVTEEGHCAPQVPIVTVIAAWGLAVELAIWILPIPVSWNLQLPLSSKIALTVIFGLGIFDIGVGIGRLVTILQVEPKDPTWTEVPALSCIAVEPSIAILVACLCVCRPLLEFLLPRRFHKLANHAEKTFHGTRSRRSGHSSGGTSSSLTAEDRSNLVTHPHTFTHAMFSVGNKGIGEDNGRDSAGELEEMQEGIVHVRRDIIVSADDKV